MSNNGKIMLDIIERQNLEVANASDVCNGTITRERVAGGKTETSIIDFIIICERMRKYLKEMKIDDKREFILSRYLKTKHNQKLITSDHNVLIGKFSIRFDRKPRRIRQEFFQFKCEEGNKIFKEETSSNTHLSSCFSDPDDFKTNANKFYKALKGTFHKCFKKIRIKTGNTSIIGTPSIQAKLKQKDELMEYVANSSCKMAQCIAKSKIEEVEKAIAEETAETNVEKVKEYIKSVETLEGSFCQVGFWKLKQKIWPSSCDPPMAKQDNDGNLITAPGAPKKLYLKTYVNRLKHRPMKPELMDVYFLKTELWMSRLDNMRKIKTPPWDHEKLDIVLGSL